MYYAFLLSYSQGRGVRLSHQEIEIGWISTCLRLPKVGPHRVEHVLRFDAAVLSYCTGSSLDTAAHFDAFAARVNRPA